MWLIPFVLTIVVLVILCFTNISGVAGAFICILVFIGSMALVILYSDYKDKEHIEYLLNLPTEKLEEKMNALIDKEKKSKRDFDEIDLIITILNDRDTRNGRNSLSNI